MIAKHILDLQYSRWFSRGGTGYPPQVLSGPVKTQSGIHRTATVLLYYCTIDTVSILCFLDGRLEHTRPSTRIDLCGPVWPAQSARRSFSLRGGVA